MHVIQTSAKARACRSNLDESAALKVMASVWVRKLPMQDPEIRALRVSLGHHVA